MFECKTLFIVGAGASAEVGLPTGSDLKSRIANKLDILFEDGWKQNSGSYGITDALREAVREQGSRDINQHLTAAWKIRDSMPLAISIDNYIDAHRGDKAIELCGKLAIVESILEAERGSQIFVDFRTAERRLAFNRVSGTWYTKLFQILSANLIKKDVSNIFANISFVTFNYDRCIEQFFSYALQNYYQMRDDEAFGLMGSLSVIHPFGAVGPLQWQAKDGIAFGADIGGRKLLDLSSKIRTFTERIEEKAVLDDIRLRVREAETIVFLGFSFQELNMKLLDSVIQAKAARVFATALAISPNDCEVVVKDIRTMLHKKPQHADAIVRNDLTCSKLFDEYWRTLPRK